MLIDASAGLRGEIGAQLGNRGWSVLADSSEARVETLVEVFQPDLAISELNGRDPTAVVRSLRCLRPIPVLITLPLTTDPHVRTLVLQAGADDTLVKPFEVDELVARVETVMRRNGAGATLEFDDVTLDEVGHTVRRGDTRLELTVTEFNLLAAFLRNPGRVMSKRQLLAAVWGFDDYDVNLVEVHVSALRKKLEVSGPRVIQTVRGVGYVLRSGGRAHNGFQRRGFMNAATWLL